MIQTNDLSFWLMLGLIALLVLAVFVLLMGRRLSALHTKLDEVALALKPVGDLNSRAEALHRELLKDLHEQLGRQTDRFVSSQGEAGERQRTAQENEARQMRDLVQTNQLGQVKAFAEQREEILKQLAELANGMQLRQDQLRTELIEKTLQSLAEQGRAERELLTGGLTQTSGQLTTTIESLTRTVNERLERISGVVTERLDEGFKKTNETFANVMARLATIDEAQKKIDGLTTNVVSLQELLGDKKSRGAFGEVQLEGLVRNLLPPGSYEFQYGLPGNVRADCVLKLPEPTGMVAVDSKFPLENYHRMFDDTLSELERRSAQNAFRSDVKKHVDAIATKYIVQDVTSDGAVMFVPAEAVFAEIHAYHAEVVDYAQQRRVWIVSPTTLMAVLNTARAVLKDVETRKQIHVIKDALGKLSKDFARFDERMQKLATHIRQAHDDVQDVQTSSRKISTHFKRIENAELEDDDGDEPLALP